MNTLEDAQVGWITYRNETEEYTGTHYSKVYLNIILLALL